MEKCLVSHDFINMAIAHGRETRPCLAIIATFCCVDDLWNQVTQGKRIRQGGFTPSLSVAQSNNHGDCGRISRN